jgi:hypothetical protein
MMRKICVSFFKKKSKPDHACSSCDITPSIEFCVCVIQYTCSLIFPREIYKLLYRVYFVGQLFRPYHHP